MTGEFNRYDELKNHELYCRKMGVKISKMPALSEMVVEVLAKLTEILASNEIGCTLQMLKASKIYLCCSKYSGHCVFVDYRERIN